MSFVSFHLAAIHEYDKEDRKMAALSTQKGGLALQEMKILSRLKALSQTAARARNCILHTLQNAAAAETDAKSASLYAFHIFNIFIHFWKNCGNITDTFLML